MAVAFRKACLGHFVVVEAGNLLHMDSCLVLLRKGYLVGTGKFEKKKNSK